MTAILKGYVIPGRRRVRRRDGSTEGRSDVRTGRTGNRRSTTSGPRPRSHDTRRGKRGEARVPPAVAVLVAIALYAVLPEPLLIGPRFLIPALELALLVALIATNPWRMTRQTRWSRRASLALAILVVTSNLVTLALLVVDLVSDRTPRGPAC